MSTFFWWNIKTLVRRKGAIDTAACRGDDETNGWHDEEGEFHRVNSFEYGDRRTRQIARRHWIKRTDKAWSSLGGGSLTVTICPPGKGKHLIKKPIYC